MKSICKLSIVWFLTMTSAAAVEAPHFAYSGGHGPANWSTLSPAYSVCQAGKNQSPVDIVDKQDVDLPMLELKYSTLALNFVNNGHAVQANYAAGSTMADDYHEDAPNKAHVTYAPGSTVAHLGSTYELKQFHFHSPSEHQVDGKNMPAEVHFVHADSNGHLAVIAVFVAEGPAHPTVTQLWQNLPGEEGDSRSLDRPISASDMLPETRDYSYYYYQGSLTTPPCSEGVRWLLMKEPISMSAEQLAALKRAIGFDNNRPVQPLNGRVIFE